jgi:hypothetical protein
MALRRARGAATMTSPTANLEVHVSAEMLTDPAQAHRLAAGFKAIFDHEINNGEHVNARFIDALMGALSHYADELERAHDQVVREVSDHWFKDQP